VFDLPEKNQGTAGDRSGGGTFEGKDGKAGISSEYAVTERYCTFKYKTGSVCGRKLAELNTSDQCYHHSYPTEEEEMARVKGTCTNCKRGPMAVQKRGEHGLLCASCGAAIAGLGGSDAVAALFDVAKKFEGKPVMKMSPKKPAPEPKPLQPPKPPAIAVATPNNDQFLGGLIAKLQEINAAAWKIYGALAIASEMGIPFVRPEIKWPE